MAVTKIGNKDLLLILSCVAIFCSYLHTIFLGQDLLIEDLNYMSDHFIEFIKRVEEKR